jgi:hypothetical protein
MTASEVIFERFCKERDIEFRRIEPRETRTPDYEIRLASGQAAVEVKQLEPGTSDRELLNKFRRGRAVSHWVNMGRPREALLDGARQLRAYVRGVMPGIVVLFDTSGGLLGYLDADSIGHSMYGPRQVHFIDGEERDVEVVGASLGGRRVATERHNTTLSAASVLRLFQNGRMSLAVFHNCYAALPLSPSDLRVPDVEHFIWATDREEALPRWTRAWVNE